MSNIRLREPQAADWDTLEALANASLAGISTAPSQAEWARNRKSFPVNGLRRQIIAERESAIVGYAAAEHHPDAPAGGFRLFVVTRAEDRDELGDILLRWLEARLGELGATETWFVEYAANTALCSYLVSKGYRETRRIPLNDGTEAVVMAKTARPAKPVNWQ